VSALRDAVLSTDHDALLATLAAGGDFLVIQDLDGVCMGLVRDPLTRTMDPAYLQAARALRGRFFVLTNGEHEGRRGVNRIVEAALGDAGLPRLEGLYLPGLAAGGVQLQDARGRVSHPGVSEAELAFLAAVPQAAGEALRGVLTAAPFALPAADIDALVASCVLDNALSPTLNLNPLYEHYAAQTAQYRQLQHVAQAFMRGQLERAADAGLGDAFFLHLAPNAGSDLQGERLRPCDGATAGTTDFQLMLSGAVKEVGVLVLLNHYLAQRLGYFPLGEDFNARAAPRDLDALVALARRHIDPAHMPRLIGVGDTISSHRDPQTGQYHRGGSDRGFLTLVQALGEAFGTDNATLFVDSSAGEVRRPGVDGAALEADPAAYWRALEGISDREDTLRLNFLFSGGHRDYTRFFCALAARTGS
jgi:glucosylglycerol 3-phosphatase